MAKAKAKKLPIVAIIFGAIALLAIFLPAIQAEVMNKTYTNSGLDIVFGYKEKGEAIFKFSFLALLPYLAVIAGIVLTSIGRKGNNLMLFVSVACFVVAAVLFFMTMSLVVPANAVVEVSLEKMYKIGTGAIAAAGTCVLCAIINLISGLKK